MSSFINDGQQLALIVQRSYCRRLPDIKSERDKDCNYNIITVEDQTLMHPVMVAVPACVAPKRDQGDRKV